jgi:cytoskeletal protein CcmA (bactofilin family)
MFSKGTAPKSGRDNVPSIISQATHIVGDITTDGEVQIDGKVEGNIRCHSLIVAESGEVSGKVACESVTVHGTLTGTVHGRSVNLSSTARLVGDITHETLTIEAGAHVQGQCIPVEKKLDSKKEGVVALSEVRASLPAPPKTKEAAGG